LNEAEELARRINKLRVTFKLETGETEKRSVQHRAGHRDAIEE